MSEQIKATADVEPASPDTALDIASTDIGSTDTGSTDTGSMPATGSMPPPGTESSQTASGSAMSAMSTQWHQPSMYRPDHAVSGAGVDTRPRFTVATTVLLVGIVALMLAILLAMIVGRDLLPNSDTLFPGAASSIENTLEQAQ